MSATDSFWSQVERGEPDACWLWTGKKIKGGYGDHRVPVDGQWKHVIAHRFVWQEAHGPIPPGLFVLHRCDVPACVNPAHLFLGTASDNMRDMVEKGRAADQRGASNAAAKLTPEHVLEIRRLVNEEHQSRTSVGRRFGLHPWYVNRIAKGTAWASLPLEAPPWMGHARRGRPRKIRESAKA